MGEVPQKRTGCFWTGGEMARKYGRVAATFK